MPIRLTKTVKVLLIVCFASFLIQQTADQFLGMRLLEWFAFIPSAFISHFRFWQLFTYPFVHRDVMHLFFNLMMLAFIGSELEAIWGRRRFLTYFFFCSTSSALIYLISQLAAFGVSAASMPMIGSSGAIYGLLMAYGLIFGDRVLLFMMLFPMKAKHFIWVLVLLELLTTVYSSGGAWASMAQLGGMFAGFGYLWVRASILVAQKQRGQNGKQGFWNRQKKRRSNHLKLIVNNNPDFESSDDESESGPKTWH